MKANLWKSLLLVPALLMAVACTKAPSTSYKVVVKKALEQSELQDVTVSEDRDRNTITLGGTVHSDDAKRQAGEVAKSVAGERIVANEVSIQPVGVESEAKAISSNLDDGIEKNYKAELIASRLDKESIDFKAKKSVLTLTGNVKSATQRQEAEKLASAVPNVLQVVNQIDVKR